MTEQDFEMFKTVEQLWVRIPNHYLTYQPFRIGDKSYDGIDEVFEDYPNLKDEDDNFIMIINIHNGHVVNWPKNKPTDMYTIKITDVGEYMLMDNEFDPVVFYKGYVPKCFGDKYGDYFEFEIDEKGFIKDWNFDETDYEEFLKYAE